MDGICTAYGGDMKNIKQNFDRKTEGRVYSGYWRMMLKLILRKLDVRVWTGLYWLTIRSIGGLL
jgi:hypothetical protein